MMSLAALILASVAFGADEPDRVTLDLTQFLDLYEKTRDRPVKPAPPPRDHALAAARYVGEVLTKDGEADAAVFHARFRVEVLTERGWVRVPLLPATVAVSSAKINGFEAPVVVEDGRYVLVTDRRGAFEVDVEFAVAVSSAQGSTGFAFELVPSGATELDLGVPAADALDFKVANARLERDRVEGSRRIVHAVLPGTGSLAVSWQRAIPEAAEQQARVHAEVHTLVGVGEGLLQGTVTIHESILFAGVDALRVKVPTDLTVLDVRGTGLRDWSIAGDGTLTAQLNFFAEGSYELTLDVERVLGEGEPVRIPIIEPIGVERSKGWVGVQALGTVEVVAGSVVGAAPVDVRTLPADIVGVTDQPVLLGFKYLGAGAEIPVAVSDHDEVDVLVTLVDQADATTMSTADGRRLTSVRYQVRNNRRQFLRLSMPEGAELWSASVAGRSVQPAKDGDGRMLVPLIRSSAAGGDLAAFTVEVVYVENGEAPDRFGHGTFAAQLPVADVPSTYVAWTVYVPHDANVKKRSFTSNLRDVDWLSRPVPAVAALEVRASRDDFQQVAGNQVAQGGLGQGAAPVEVSLPLDGQALYFEKLLALDEDLGVSFRYKGLK